MKVIRTIGELRNELRDLKLRKKIISFVPTMGYLHEGHLSLVRYAKQNSDFCVVSIFVNPTQFAPNEDFNRYPRDEQRDLSLLEKEKCDYVFIPSAQEMYGENYQTYVKVRKYSEILEGEFRPTHFEGVTTVVIKLFNIVQPDFAVFGQKDAQQAFIIQKMVDDLNIPIRIDVLPIVREVDGLAMSSRNVYLQGEERNQALCLYKGIQLAEKLYNEGERSAKVLIEKVKNLINQFSLAQIDYVEIVEKKSFKKADLLKEGNEYYLLLAVRIGNTRLIDNTILGR
ncbi:MAG: pantoate--beta-alanine ligase [Ignavibacteria bacterium]|jgi:pantoate--beta-alanine ligase|nr:pantoate--beta-alanine ligase [Ignavibacteria bacterium]MDH7528086.1 pantoate--beta-alanine ligase [Ignavibacteria bacterium]